MLTASCALLPDLDTRDRFRLAGDREMWTRIVTDLIDHAGELAPAEHWVTLQSHLSDAEFQHRSRPPKEEQLKDYLSDAYWERFLTLDTMLDPFIGFSGMQPLSEEVWETYQPFLSQIDHLNLIPRLGRADQFANYRVSDLGSLMDLNLMCYPSAYNLGREAVAKPEMILEVGGGYGRLAEAWLASKPQENRGCYVLLDAVPGALMYAYLYLKQAFPNQKIGSFYNDDPFDLEAYDAYIMPVWHFERLNQGLQYDLCINVESMQEMHQEHVNYYFDLFDRYTKDHGVVYISNCHDYVFQGVWPYPDHWQCLFRQNTPRSWKLNHPTEVFVKTRESHVRLNALNQKAFEFGVELLRQRPPAPALQPITLPEPEVIEAPLLPPGAPILLPVKRGKKPSFFRRLKQVFSPD